MADIDFDQFDTTQVDVGDVGGVDFDQFYVGSESGEEERVNAAGRVARELTEVFLNVSNLHKDLAGIKTDTPVEKEYRETLKQIVEEATTDITNGKAVLTGLDTLFSPISATASGVKALILGQDFGEAFTNRIAQATDLDIVLNDEFGDVRNFSETPEDKHFREVAEGKVQSMNDLQLLGLVQTDIAEALAPVPAGKGKIIDPLIKTGKKIFKPIAKNKNVGKFVDTMKSKGREALKVATRSTTIDGEVGLFDRAMVSVSSNLKRMGVHGKELAERMEAVRDFGELQAGTLIEDMRLNIAKLSAKEKRNLVEVLDGTASPINKTVREAASAERKRLNTIYDQAKRDLDGVDLPAFRDDYFPHIFEGNVMNNSGFRQNAVEEMMKSGRYASKSEAEDAFSQWMQSQSGRKYGNLEKSRLAEVDGWIKDPEKALSMYYSRASRRVAEGRYLGANDDVANSLIDNIVNAGGDGEFARKVLRDFTGKNILDTSTQRFLSRVTGFETVTKLGLAQLTNLPQGVVNTALSTNVTTALKALKNSFTKEGRSFANRTGATLQSTMDELARLGDEFHANGNISSKFLKLTGFTAIETQNRIVAALGGKMRAEWAFDVLKSGKTGAVKGKAERFLKEMGIDATEVLSRGGLTQDELLRAGLRFSNKTQFRSGTLDVPQFFRSPWGRVFTQFKSFAFNHAKFLKDIIKEEGATFASSNSKEVLKQVSSIAARLGFANIAGELSKDLRMIAQFKDPSERETGLNRYLENMYTVGGLGIFTDMVNSLRFGESGVTGFLFGPAVTDIIKGISRVGRPLTEGDFDKAGSNFLTEGTRQIPVFGGAITRSIKE